MKLFVGLLLPFLFLVAGCAANRQQVASGPVIQCPEVYNGCYAD